MIVGWRAATRMTADRVLDTFKMAVWNRGRAGTDLPAGCTTPTPAQYTSFAFT